MKLFDKLFRKRWKLTLFASCPLTPAVGEVVIKEEFFSFKFQAKYMANVYEDVPPGFLFKFRTVIERVTDGENIPS